MKRLPNITIFLAVICVVIAIVSKAAAGTPIPGVPLSWLRVADTCLLFSIALSLLGIKEK